MQSVQSHTVIPPDFHAGSPDGHFKERRRAHTDRRQARGVQVQASEDRRKNGVDRRREVALRLAAEDLARIETACGVAEAEWTTVDASFARALAEYEIAEADWSEARAARSKARAAVTKAQARLEQIRRQPD